MTNTITLYLREEDRKIYQRAKKLLAFHEDKSISASLIELCREVVKRYEIEDQDTA
jgi:hypothetical protein